MIAGGGQGFGITLAAFETQGISHDSVGKTQVLKVLPLGSSSAMLSHYIVKHLISFTSFVPLQCSFCILRSSKLSWRDIGNREQWVVTLASFWWSVIHKTEFNYGSGKAKLLGILSVCHTSRTPVQYVVPLQCYFHILCSANLAEKVDGKSGSWDHSGAI